MEIRWFFLSALLSFLPAAVLGAGDKDGFALGLPIACSPGQNCWIPNYMDHQPGKGVLDYNCGVATYDAPPNDQHNGTDFAIQDMEAVRRGIAVQAAAPGTVEAVRDGMADVDLKDARPGSIRNRECGNAVIIKHGNGMTTQYCHMRRGSVAVRAGDVVERGRHLGYVGLSGMTMFPHLHFQVENGHKLIDPFTGPDRKNKCGIGEHALWDEKTLAMLPYQPTAIYNTGFSSEPPSAEKMREGLYKEQRIPIKAKAIIFWADVFNVRMGDEITLKITGPDHKGLMEKRFRIKQDQARYYLYSGAPLMKPVWRPGTYLGEIALTRQGQKPEEITAANTVLVR